MKEKYNLEDIRELSFVEAVHLRPHLYFAACFEKQQLDDLIFEALCPALDAHLKGECSSITINIYQKSFEVSFDTGLSLQPHKSLPLTHTELIMTQHFACSNLKKHLTIGDEFCKIGLAALNAGAAHCTLTTI